MAVLARLAEPARVTRGLPLNVSPRLTPGKDATAQKCALKRVIAVVSAAAKASNLARRIKAGQGAAIGTQGLPRKIGVQPAKRLAGQNVQPHRDQWPGLGVKQPMGRAVRISLSPMKADRKSVV